MTDLVQVGRQVGREIQKAEGVERLREDEAVVLVGPINAFCEEQVFPVNKVKPLDRSL